MSIKAIVLFEKMTDVPFSELSFSEDSILQNPEIFLKLLYCILISHQENKINCTFEDACAKVFTEEMLLGLSAQLSNELSVMNQFVNFKNLRNVDEISIKEKPENEEHKPVYMKRLVPILILDCGLGVDFVLNELNYTDIDDYLKYREDKHRNDLEEKRLFTYLSTLPHIDGKKIKSPEKFCPFPWEKEKAKQEALAGIKKVRNRLVKYGIIQEKS